MFSWFADFSARHRNIVFLIMVAITALATWGQFHKPPVMEESAAPLGESRSAKQKSAAEKTAPREKDKPASPPTSSTKSETAATPASKSTTKSPPAEKLETRSERLASAFDFQSSEAVLIVSSKDMFTPANIAAVRRIVREVEALDCVDSVFWADRVPQLNVFGIADPLIPPDGATPEAFRQSKERLQKNPVVVGQLMSADGNSLMLPIVYDWLMATDDNDVTERVLSAARTAAASDKSASVDVRFTGAVPIYMAYHDAFHQTSWMFRVIGYGLVTVLAAILFRGWAALLISAAGPALGLYWTFGLLSLFERPINDLTAVILPVLLGMVGFTDSVHLVAHLRQRRADGELPEEATAGTLRTVGPACWMTSLTTAIGFGSLLTSHSPFVHSFGEVCGIGVLVAFVAVLLFVPWASSGWIGSRLVAASPRDLLGRIPDVLAVMLEFILRHHRLVSATSVLLTGGLALYASQLRPDDLIEEALPASTQAYSALEYADQNFGGIAFVRVELTWPENVPSDSPQILEAIHAVETLVADEPLLHFPMSIRSLMSSFPGEKDDYATQMTFLWMMPPELRAAFFNPDKRQTTIALKIEEKGIAEYAPVFERVEKKLAKLADSYPGYQFTLTGGAVKRATSLFRIVTDLTVSLLTASIIIFGVMGAACRSWRLGLISVIPNLFPLAVTGAMLVAWGRPLDLAAVCAFTICLGIAVDDTIHFLARYQIEIVKDGDSEAAIRRSMRGVGAAMVMTTVVLIAGFATVMFSQIPVHRVFAAMACATIGSALPGDLFFLPALLTTFAPKKARPLAPVADGSGGASEGS